MSAIDKVKEALVSKTVEASISLVSMLLIFVFWQLAPAIIKSISITVSPQILLALLTLSIVINIFLVALFIYSRTKEKSDLKLRFGVYWDKDKNPYCPVCKNVLASSNSWGELKNEYYCNPCKTLVNTTDASGNTIPRKQAIEKI
jgi:hypothetical protein